METNNNKTTTKPTYTPPVDLERITTLAGGETDRMSELVASYLTQTARQLSLIEAAIHNRHPEVIRYEAQSCSRTSTILGMSRLGGLFKELEHQGTFGTLTAAAGVCADAKAELQRVREFLAIKLA